MTIPSIHFENGAATQTDDNTITVTAPDLTNGVWKSNKEVVTNLSYNSTTGELTVTKDYLEVQPNQNS